MIYLTPATPEHVLAMAGRIRRADVEEFAAGYSLTPERGMMIGLQVSSHCWAGIYKQRVIAIAGLAADPEFGCGLARPWMVGTRDLERKELMREFLRVSKDVLRHMLDLYPHLENYVDARNTLAIRWLKWLGFKFDEAAPHGPKGMLFHRFEMRSDHV